MAEAVYTKPVRGDDDHRIRDGRGVDFVINLEPGKYVLLCNLTGHYQAGQFMAFTVEGDASTAATTTPVPETPAADATVTLDFALSRLAQVVAKLVVYPDAMRANLDRLKGRDANDPAQMKSPIDGLRQLIAGADTHGALTSAGKEISAARRVGKINEQEFQSLVELGRQRRSTVF